MSKVSFFATALFAGFLIQLIFIPTSHAAAVPEGKTQKFEVNVELSIDGELVSSPHMIVPNGESSSVTIKNKKGEEMVLQLRASDLPKKGLKQGVIMRFAVGYNRDGKTEIISRPHILANIGEAAELSVHDTKTSETIKIKAIATAVP